MNLGLENRRVLVSGGSRGIGKAIVQCFLDEGAHVAFCARSASGVAEAERALGGRAFGAVVDVTQPGEVQHWVANAVQRLGGLDIIVPNVSALAGGSDLETWRKAFDTDLLGSVAMVQAALPHLLQSDAASVVLISSVSGREVDRFAEPYGVLKAALLHYAKTLSARHAADGIRVNSVSPGNVYFDEGVWGEIARNDPQTFADCLAANPMGRMATPEEVARATVFLASPAASYTTGTSLLVDGGLTKGVQF
jgi:NAD(P)-dependent dehydrogenase (short-subunit alcohol dehydrogenase family)